MQEVGSKPLSFGQMQSLIESSKLGRAERKQTRRPTCMLRRFTEESTESTVTPMNQSINELINQLILPLNHFQRRLKCFAQSERTNNCAPRAKQSATVARKSFPGGRNLEQVQAPEGRHLPPTSVCECSLNSLPGWGTQRTVVTTLLKYWWNWNLLLLLSNISLDLQSLPERPVSHRCYQMTTCLDWTTVWSALWCASQSLLPESTGQLTTSLDILAACGSFD